MDKEKLQRGLGLFLDAMRPYVVSVIERECKAGLSWDEDFESRMDNERKKSSWQMQRMKLNNNGSSLTGLIDYNNLVTFVINYRDSVTKEVGNITKNYNRLRSCLQELQDTRNNWAHFDQDGLDEDEAERAFSNMVQVAKLLEMVDLEDELKRVKGGTQAKVEATPQVERVQAQSLKQDNTEAVDYSGVLPAWYNSIMPQYDIRNGQLDESVFAANIEEVATGTAPVVYQDLVSFFDRTYVTDGMRELIRRVVQALNGKESQNRVISLQTGFGGGKTHSLISLYHVVKDSRTFRDLAAARAILDPEDMPQFDNARVAVFTQNTVSVVDGHQVEDGVITHTLWGELAWQLGGKEGYERVKNADIQMIAPTAKDIKPVIEGASPALILIDELADYCNKASGKVVGSGTLFTQTNSFIQTLTEVVSSIPKTVLICTLPASAREVASSEIGQEILSSLETRVVRVGSSVKPVDDEEIYEVVRRRLFDRMADETVIEKVARKYKDMYHNRRDSLPAEADRVAYVERIKKAYPFHPELIDLFRVRWGSDSRFQRTRGVLRLLASIVKDLWQRRASLVGTQALIQTSDVQMENLPTLQSQITSLMGAQWDSVMHADVIGTISNAYKLDEQNAGNNIGEYHLATAVTTTVLMASIGASSQKGLSLKQLKLCLLKPDAFQHIDIDSTVNQLENIVHYMYRSSIGGEQSYWFQSKPNINILINQAKGDVKDDEINAEILQMIKQSVMTISKVKVLVDPSGDVPEQKQLTFVVMHPKYTVAAGGNVSRSAELAIKQMAQMKGSSQRVYRNTMLYLLSSEAGKAAMSMKLREYLACDKIIKEYSSQLDPDQRKDVADRKKLSADAAKEQLIHAYNTVVKCERDTLNTQEINSFASEFAAQISVNTLNELHENGLVLRKIGLNIINRNGLMPTVEKPVKVNDVYEAFLRFDDKPMILNAEAITDTVNRYCEEGMWNVGTGAGEPYSRIYHNERVTFLNPQEDGYWLLDPSVMPKPAVGGGPTPEPPTPGPTPPTPGSEPGSEPTPTTKTYKKVTISGSVPIENYSQLFSSFVNTLKNNHLKIEVKFTANNSSANPLTDNSPIVKSVKESASQLGLEFEVEE
jgi:hypothetical protein